MYVYTHTHTHTYIHIPEDIRLTISPVVLFCLAELVIFKDFSNTVVAKALRAYVCMYVCMYEMSGVCVRVCVCKCV